MNTFVLWYFRPLIHNPPAALQPNGKTLGRVANPTAEAKVPTIRSSATTFNDSDNTFEMKYIHSKETLEIPEGVKVHIKTRTVTVEGPRGENSPPNYSNRARRQHSLTRMVGKLTKDLGHLSVSFSHPKKNIINIELHHGTRKNVATLRTVRTLINNMIIGVTKGFRYKMRYVYAHFPINVNIEKDNETGLYDVEIRCVLP